MHLIVLSTCRIAEVIAEETCASIPPKNIKYTKSHCPACEQKQNLCKCLNVEREYSLVYKGKVVVS